MKSRSSLMPGAQLCMALSAVGIAMLGANMGGADVYPRPGSDDDFVARPRSSGAYGGSSRYPYKGRKRPAGSKLARKAARGKL